MGRFSLVVLAVLWIPGRAYSADDIPELARSVVSEHDRAVADARRKHGEASRSSLEKLNARLDELIEGARTRGNLDAVLALQAERDGAERSPGTKATQLPAEAQAARKAFDVAHRQGDQQFRRSVDKAHLKLLSDLESLEKAETKANRIESAVAIRTFREARERNGPPELTERIENPAVQGVFVDWETAWQETGSLVRQAAIDAGDRPVAIIWLVDASASLDHWRKHLAAGAARFHNEVAGAPGAAQRTVTTGVAVFGAGFSTPLFPPSDNPALAETAIRGVTADPSGRENLCAAILGLSAKVAAWRQEQQVLVILVTDERGDDLEKLEDAILAARNAGTTLFAISAESPFGAAKGRLAWTFPDGQTEWLSVDSGPETALPELAPLPDWGGTTAESGKILTSGFGPYLPGRLCEATGGHCLAVRISDPGAIHPDPAATAKYRPDYRSAREIQADHKTNLAKAAVTQLAVDWLAKRPSFPPLVIEADKTGTKAARMRALREADEGLRRLDKHLDRFHDAQPDRTTVRDRRAQAAFDLHRGWLWMLRARLAEYRRVLSESLADATLNKSPALKLVRAKALAETDEIKQAKGALEAVVLDHPGTPWAMLADRSLKEDWGWELQPVTQNSP